MQILYRCPSCLSVIERTTAWDELARLAPERALFECGICGNIMPGADVLSGKYDLAPDKARIPSWKVIVLEILRKVKGDGRAEMPPESPFLHDLLPQLREEHKTGYVYRGQTKLWSGRLSHRRIAES